MDCITQRQIEKTITTLARRAGLSGDPFAPVPVAGPPAMELAAEALVLDAGCYEVANEEKQFARRLARGIVFSSKGRRASA